MSYLPAAFLTAAAALWTLPASATSLVEDSDNALLLAQLDTSGEGSAAPAGTTMPQRDDEPDEALAEADQSSMETPEAFRFPGAMASVWSRQMVEAINQDIHVTLPLMIHSQEFFDEGTYVWDAWPIRNLDGSVAEFDGWVVMVALSSTWEEVEESGNAFYTLSEWRYWYTRDGDWRPGGTIFSRQEGLGSRQWAGSTFYDADSGLVTFYYTAVGDPEAPSLEEDPAPGPVSIFNEGPDSLMVIARR